MKQQVRGEEKEEREAAFHCPQKSEFLSSRLATSSEHRPDSPDVRVSSQKEGGTSTVLILQFNMAAPLHNTE